jgi:hypothetical protein
MEKVNWNESCRLYDWILCLPWKCAAFKGSIDKQRNIEICAVE